MLTKYRMAIVEYQKQENVGADLLEDNEQ